MNKKKEENSPIIQIMKLSGLLRPINLLFFLLWLTICVTDTAKNVVIGAAIDQNTRGAGNILFMIEVCLGCTIYSYIFSIISRYLQNRCIENRIKDLREWAGYKLVNVPFIEIENMQRGEIISRTMGDLEKIQTFFESSLSGFFIYLVEAAAGLSISLWISWKLTVAIMLTIPVIILFNIISTKSVEGLMLAQKEEVGHGNAIAMNILQQLTSVKAFGLEMVLSGRYFEQLKKIEQAENRITYKKARLAFVQCISSTLLYLTLMSVGGILSMRNELTVGGFVIIMMLVYPIAGFVANIQSFIYALKECRTGSRRLLGILKLKEEKSQEGVAVISGSEQKKALLTDYISFTNVTFTYQLEKTKACREVLHNINLHIGEGQKIAIVGPSGCGKSTLIKLISALYTVQEGQIWVDGILVGESNANVIRERIAVVLQENYLFPMTIADNIRCGNPEADDEEVIEAASNAGIHQFICSLPKGYQTVLGENGATLSGGQRQRICIARAYIQKPKILILDEPTASLDTESERIVQHSIDNLMQGKTTIIVAHRLSTIKNADMIYCMKDGEIVEAGTHNNLYEMRGCYYHLYKNQEQLVYNA